MKQVGLLKGASKMDTISEPEKTENSKTSGTENGAKEPPLDKGKVRVFVYGSLKSQCGNNILLQRVGAECMGFDSITGEFTMMSFGGFPGVVRDKAGESEEPQLTTIFGEMYMTDEEGLAALDMLESHPDWYERRKYRTDVLDRNCWMYTLPRSGGYLDTSSYDRVEGNIWRPSQEELDFWAGSSDEDNTDVA